MNRLLCRRYAVNIFWTVIYGCLVGYVFYANYAVRLNPVATLDREALTVVAVALCNAPWSTRYYGRLLKFIRPGRCCASVDTRGA